MDDASPALRVQLWVALAIAASAAVLCWLSFVVPPASISDFDHIHVAARTLLAGGDPYAVVASSTDFPLFYPLPAVLLALPTAFVPLPFARAAWAALGAGALTLAAQRYGRGLPVALLSAPFLNAVVQGQWSPLVTAGAVLPILGCAWAAKPSLGAALFVGYPSRRAAWSALVIVIVSLVIMPTWPGAWWAALRSSNHRIPILQPGGFLLGLALLRWRAHEARLFMALACVPQTIGFYELLPLFLIPRHRREAYVIAVLTYVAAFAAVFLFPRHSGESIEALQLRRWPVLLLLVYLPVLFLVLRQPSNKAPLRKDDPTSPLPENYSS